MNKKKRRALIYLVCSVIIILTLAYMVLSGGFHKKSGVQFSEGDLITIENENISLTIDMDKMGAIVSIKDKVSRREFISSGSDSYLYMITQKTAITGKGIFKFISSQNSSCFDYYTEEDSKKITLTINTCHPDEGLDVTSIISINKKDSSLNFHIEVANSGEQIIQSVEYPIIDLTPKLGDDSSDDYFIYPYKDGAIINDIYNLPNKKYVQSHPGQLSMQFLAFYDKSNQPGLYIQSEDINGNYKRVSFMRENKDSEDFLRVSYKNFISENYGNDFALDYNIKLKTFYGDWYDAADIYKKWALKQWWAEKTIWERDDIPQWLFDATIAHNGNRPFATENFFDINNEILKTWYLDDSIPFDVDFKGALFSVGGLWGRPNTLWSGGNYFYPFKGDIPIEPVEEDKLYAQINLLNSINVHTSLWLSATRFDLWETESEINPGGVCDWDTSTLVFNDTEDFNAINGDDYVIIKESGEKDFKQIPFMLDKCRKGDSAIIGVGSKKDNLIDFMLDDNILRGIKRGASLMSLDQIIGGWIDADFNEKYINNRGVGYGIYMHNRFIEILDGLNSVINDEGKKGEFGIGMEATNEYYIPYVQSVLLRPVSTLGVIGNSTGMTLSKIPLFSYIYNDRFISYDSTLDSYNVQFDSITLYDASVCAVNGGIPSVRIADNVDMQYPVTENVIFLRKLISNIGTEYRGAEILNPPEIYGIPRDIETVWKKFGGNYFYNPVVFRVLKKHDNTISYIFINTDDRTDSLSLSFNLENYYADYNLFDVYKKTCGKTDCQKEQIIENSTIENKKIEFAMEFSDLVIFDIIPKGVVNPNFSNSTGNKTANPITHIIDGASSRVGAIWVMLIILVSFIGICVSIVLIRYLKNKNI
ncbi:MAG: DUF6259 domain-containing protein [Candidatus Pacearchaeota archaeon]